MAKRGLITEITGQDGSFLTQFLLQKGMKSTESSVGSRSRTPNTGSREAGQQPFVYFRRLSVGQATSQRTGGRPQSSGRRSPSDVICAPIDVTSW